MAIAVRKADLEVDRRDLMAFLRQHLTPQSDYGRFDWLYKDNPYGPAQAWVAIDTKRDLMVGVASAFPRRFYVAGREQTGAVLGDFCIHSQYRSLGPALQLQRACLAAVDGVNLALCYDFPSQSMMTIYKRLHLEPSGQLVRLAKPLRVERKVKALIKAPFISRGLSAAGNLVLSALDRRSISACSRSLSLHTGACGEEFSVLARKVSSLYGACTQRSADFLNWRYLAHPSNHYEILTLRNGGELQVYAIFTQSGGDATLVDLFGFVDGPTGGELVGGLVDLLRKRGAVTVSAPILDLHPWLAFLQQLGFRKRESCPVIIYVPSCTGIPSSKRRAFEWPNWLLVDGDREG